MSLLTFHEHYVPRVWGGQNLAERYNKPLPDEPIGEAWLISDHHSHSSVVNRGPLKGRTLSDLLAEDPDAILGTRATLTRHKRFPLLFKILDCQEKLSIQVHPNDALAFEYEEQDIGKTEMWHVLDAAADANLFCGLPETLSEDEIHAAIRDETIRDILNTYRARPNASFYVDAGTIHAIGPGSLIAEIQRNSDLTYRISDWGRVDAQGKRRELHTQKALRAIRNPNTHHGEEPVLQYPADDAIITVLSACDHFAAEVVSVNGSYTAAKRGSTPHIVLVKSGDLTLACDGETCSPNPGEAALVTADTADFALSGTGSALMYYVPDTDVNVVEPLLEAGHPSKDIHRLIH